MLKGVILYGIAYLSFFLTNNTLAQYDSLENKLKHKTGKEKVDLLNTISSRYATIEPEKSYKYAEEASMLSRNLKYPEGEAHAYLNMGYANLYKGDIDSAGILFEKAIFLAQKRDDSLLMGHVYKAKGELAYSKGQYYLSRDYYLKAHQIFAKAPDDPVNLYDVKKELGAVYFDLGNYEQSLIFLEDVRQNLHHFDDHLTKKSYVFRVLGEIYMHWKNFNDARVLFREAYAYALEAKELNELGYALNELGNINLKTKNYDSAHYYYNEGHKHFLDAKNVAGQAIIMFNRGMTFEFTKQYDSAYYYYNNALAYHQENGDKYYEAHVLNALGYLFYNQNDYEQAERYAKNSLKIAKKRNYKGILASDYDVLSLIYEEKKDYRQALQYLEKYYQYHDSLFNENAVNQLNELKAQLDMESKENEVEILQKENQIKELKINRNRVVILVILVLSLFVITIVVLMMSLRHFKALNKTVELEQKILRSQMNPHFLFNALTVIQSFIYKNKNTEASLYLTTFAKMLRFNLENSKNEMINLESELEALQYYLQLQKLRFPDKINYEITIEEDKEYGSIQIFPMTIQPLVDYIIVQSVNQRGIGEFHIFVSKPKGNYISITIEKKCSDCEYRKSHLIELNEIVENRFKNLKRLKKLKIDHKVSFIKEQNGNITGIHIFLNMPVEKL